MNRISPRNNNEKERERERENKLDWNSKEIVEQSSIYQFNLQNKLSKIPLCKTLENSLESALKGKTRNARKRD